MYFEIIKNVILAQNHELEDILKKIDTAWYESKISDDERMQLIELAREKARPENSYNEDKQLETIFARLNAIENRLDEIEGKEVVADAYPEYVQPTGAHDAYKIGDRITYNNKKYICKKDNCVWSPDAYPQGWEEVVEENTTSEV